MRNRCALIAGAAGEVGEGLVRQALRTGPHVLALSRSEGRLRGLRERIDPQDAERLLTIEVDAGDPDALAAAVGDRGIAVDEAVAALGGWRSGSRLRELTDTLWDQVQRDNIEAHLRAARAILPLLDGRAAATYLMINGGAALRPVSGAAMTSVAAAAQVMMARSYEAERQPDEARVRSLVLDTPILTRSRPTGSSRWLTADEVGQEAMRLLDDPADTVVWRLFKDAGGSIQRTQAL